jgi:hypothetical protein
MIRRGVLAVAATSLVCTLAACGGSSVPNGSGNDTSGSVESGSSTPSASSPVASPVSDIDAAVSKVVATLDQLGIKHNTPTRRSVGMSGAKAAFDITVNGYSAGINVFPNTETLTTWQKASDSFGGVDVTFGNTALSLNSDEGVANSAKIAPKIAQALGGEAHGV